MWQDYKPESVTGQVVSPAEKSEVMKNSHGGQTQEHKFLAVQGKKLKH